MIEKVDTVSRPVLFPFFFIFFVIRTWKQVQGTAVRTPYVTFSRSEREVKFQNCWLINASDPFFSFGTIATEVFFTFPLMGFELRLLKAMNVSCCIGGLECFGVLGRSIVAKSLMSTNYFFLSHIHTHA